MTTTIDKQALLDTFKEFSIEELEEIKSVVEELIRTKSKEKKFVYHFYAEAHRKRRIPYAARLYYNPDEDKIEREFFKLDRTYGNGTIVVEGEFEYHPGELIELRESGGSIKHDLRYIYLAGPDGTLHEVADVENARQMHRIKQYLRGQISTKELLEGS